MFLKIHHSPGLCDVIAVCDSELLNTTLKHGDVEVHISDDTCYGSTETDEDEIRKIITGAANLNLIGKKTIKTAIECGVVEEGTCLMIGELPHYRYLGTKI